MTDKELIQTLRDYSCLDPLAIPHKAADRLEALIAENESLRRSKDAYRELSESYERKITIQEEICKWIESENEWLEAQIPQWISVKDQLPEEDDRYLCSVKSLVCNGRNYADILRYDKDGFRDGHIYTDLVTYWMTLPEPLSAEEGSAGQKG